MKNFFRVVYGVFCILGCLLGAGFISGAEVQTFFVKFGFVGIIGIVFSSIIFAIAVCKQSKESLRQGNKKFDILPYCQILISGAMLAGLSEVVANFLQINNYIVLCCLTMLLFIALVFGIKFANIFNIIVSVATVIILPIVIKHVGINNFEIKSNLNFGLGIIYAALYATINIVACMPVIKSLPVKNKKVIGILSAIITAILLGIIFVLLSGNTFNSDMPILALISTPILKAIYTVLFVVAMVSTLFSASNGAKQVFAKINNNILESVCSSLAIASISFVGFGKIINYLYPAIGIAILVQIFVYKLSKKPLKTQKISITMPK